MRMLLLLSLLAFLRCPLWAQEPPPKPAIHQVGPGVVELGAIRLDQTTRTVTFPGAINLDKGLLEYLIVGRDGPTHESLLVTDVSPAELHTVMLLLGAKGAKPAAPGVEPPPGQITAEYLKHAPKPTGDTILITAKWKDKTGAEQTAEVSDWLTFLPTKKPPARGPWLYTGSMFGSDGKFMAEQQSIIAALVTNPAALINNPRKADDDDRLWEVNKKHVPPAETPLTICIQMPAPAK